MSKNFYEKIFFLFFLINGCYSFAQYSDVEFRKILEQIRAAQKKPDSAIVIAKSYIPKLKNKTHSTEIYGVISMNYSLAGMKDQALSYAMKANQKALTTSNYSSIARSYGLLATQYRNVNLYTKAKQALRNGILNSEKIPSGEKYWINTALLLEYANNLDLEKNYDSSTVYNNYALHNLSYSKSNPEMTKYYYSVAYSNIGMNYFNKNKMDSAEYYNNKSLKISNGTFDALYRKKIVYANLSLVYYNKKEFQRAIDTLKIAEKLIKSDEYPRLAQMYNFLSKSYLAIGDSQNFRKYNNLYLEVNNKLSEEEKKTLNAIIQRMDETTQHEAKQKKINRILVFITISLALVSIGLLIFYYTRKRKKERTLYENYIKTLEEKFSQKEIVDEKDPVKAWVSVEIMEKTENQILARLCKLEKSDKFLSPDVSLSSLATDFKTNTRYLSDIIRRHKGKNFNTYINELRIEYICRNILEDPKFRMYKVSVLASISGFSSAENFSKIFKKHTGISPSVFIEKTQIQNTTN